LIAERLRPGSSLKNKSNQLQSFRLHDYDITLYKLIPSSLFSNSVELPQIGHKLYVDPTIYDSPEDALNEFASELDPSVLVLEKLIGGGR
jgi:hypothetical protein